MSVGASPRDIARHVDDPAGLGRAVDELLAARPEPPALLGLGEPTHGIEAFTLLRNELLAHLVERGFRSIVLETDVFAASIVDDYVAGGAGDVDTVLATGFSHGFGAVPGNLELVAWLRAHNAGRPPADRVRFHGCDAPVEYAGAPSPRRALAAVADYLPAALRPDSVREVDALLGEDADWTNEAAMYEPEASVGATAAARALRIVADDLASALRRAAPSLRPADRAGYDHAAAHARTAVGLLRYHAAMAGRGPDRVATLMSLRSDMMAENLLAIVGEEERRGPSLVFAHNEHLRRAPRAAAGGVSDGRGGAGGDAGNGAVGGAPGGAADGAEAGSANGAAVAWAGAGELVGLALGDRYMFVASDGSPDAAAGTFQHALAEGTRLRSLFWAEELRPMPPDAIRTAEPMVPGHIPLGPTDVDRTDAVVYIADTDGKRHQYW